MKILIRGAGDIATGIALRLYRAGMQVVMTDLPAPTAIRRTVCFSQAIILGEMTVEDVTARRAETPDQAEALLAQGLIPVLADPDCTCRTRLRPDALVDAILAKRNLGTKMDDAPIVVGIGPAPFTGLRAGIVAAKALAFATGAQLVGQDVLAPQCLAHTQATDDRRHLTLAVNDARRRQLYFALYDGGTVADGVGQSPITLIDMDIDYPDSITMRVNDVLTKLADTGKPYVVDVIGHGAVKYAQSWNAIASLGEVDDHALLDEGAEGLARFAAFTTSEQALAEPTSVEPLYLRRPDVSVPNPLKHVLNHAGAERTE